MNHRKKGLRQLLNLIVSGQVAQGIALPVAVSVAINEYLDAMLAALDPIVARAF